MSARTICAKRTTIYYVICFILTIPAAHGVECNPDGTPKVAPPPAEGEQEEAAPLMEIPEADKPVVLKCMEENTNHCLNEFTEKEKKAKREVTIAYMCGDELTACAVDRLQGEHDAACKLPSGGEVALDHLYAIMTEPSMKKKVKSRDEFCCKVEYQPKESKKWPQRLATSVTRLITFLKKKYKDVTEMMNKYIAGDGWRKSKAPEANLPPDSDNAAGKATENDTKKDTPADEKPETGDKKPSGEKSKHEEDKKTETNNEDSKTGGEAKPEVKPEANAEAKDKTDKTTDKKPDTKADTTAGDGKLKPESEESKKTVVNPTEGNAAKKNDTKDNTAGKSGTETTSTSTTDPTKEIKNGDNGGNAAEVAGAAAVATAATAGTKAKDSSKPEKTTGEGKNEGSDKKDPKESKDTANGDTSTKKPTKTSGTDGSNDKGNSGATTATTAVPTDKTSKLKENGKGPTESKTKPEPTSEGKTKAPNKSVDLFPAVKTESAEDKAKKKPNSKADGKADSKAPPLELFPTVKPNTSGGQDKSDSKADSSKANSKTDSSKANSKTESSKTDSKPDSGKSDSKTDAGKPVSKPPIELFPAVNLDSKKDPKAPSKPAVEIFPGIELGGDKSKKPTRSKVSKDTPNSPPTKESLAAAAAAIAAATNKDKGKVEENPPPSFNIFPAVNIPTTGALEPPPSPLTPLPTTEGGPVDVAGALVPPSALKAAAGGTLVVHEVVEVKPGTVTGTKFSRTHEGSDVDKLSAPDVSKKTSFEIFPAVSIPLATIGGALIPRADKHKMTDKDKIELAIRLEEMGVECLKAKLADGKSSTITVDNYLCGPHPPISVCSLEKVSVDVPDLVRILKELGPDLPQEFKDRHQNWNDYCTKPEFRKTYKGKSIKEIMQDLGYKSADSAAKVFLQQYVFGGGFKKPATLAIAEVPKERRIQIANDCEDAGVICLEEKLKATLETTVDGYLCGKMPEIWICVRELMTQYAQAFTKEFGDLNNLPEPFISKRKNWSDFCSDKKYRKMHQGIPIVEFVGTLGFHHVNGTADFFLKTFIFDGQFRTWTNESVPVLRGEQHAKALANRMANAAVVCLENELKERPKTTAEAYLCGVQPKVSKCVQEKLPTQAAAFTEAFGLINDLPLAIWIKLKNWRRFCALGEDTQHLQQLLQKPIVEVMATMGLYEPKASADFFLKSFIYDGGFKDYEKTAKQVAELTPEHAAALAVKLADEAAVCLVARLKNTSVVATVENYICGFHPPLAQCAQENVPKPSKAGFTPEFVSAKNFPAAFETRLRNWNAFCGQAFKKHKAGESEQPISNLIAKLGLTGDPLEVAKLFLQKHIFEGGFKNAAAIKARRGFSTNFLRLAGPETPNKKTDKIASSDGGRVVAADDLVNGEQQQQQQQQAGQSGARRSAGKKARSGIINVRKLALDRPGSSLVSKTPPAPGSIVSNDFSDEQQQQFQPEQQQQQQTANNVDSKRTRLKKKNMRSIT